MTAWGLVVAPQAAPPERHHFYPELDVHRGIAVLATIVFTVYQYCNVDHFLYDGTPLYTLLNSLDASVSWFFVIIGFLIFEPIARSIVDGEAALRPRAFLLRRALRVVPVLYVVVVVVWFARQESLPGDWPDLLEHLTFTQVFDSGRIFYTDGPAWAVSTGVYFVIIATVVGVLGQRAVRWPQTRRGRVIALYSATAGLAALSLAWKGWALIEHRPTTGSFATWFGPAANMDVFAAGMALAIHAVSQDSARPLSRAHRLALRLIGLGVLVAAFVARSADSWSAVFFTTFCAVGFGCIVAAAVLGSARQEQRTLTKPLGWLGLASYSIFLWHEPVLLTLAHWPSIVRQQPSSFVRDLVTVLAVSILVGWLSHVAIWRPVDGLLARMGPRPQAPVSPTLRIVEAQPAGEAGRQRPVRSRR